MRFFRWCKLPSKIIIEKTPEFLRILVFSVFSHFRPHYLKVLPRTQFFTHEGEIQWSVHVPNYKKKELVCCLNQNGYSLNPKRVNFRHLEILVRFRDSLVCAHSTVPEPLPYLSIWIQKGAENHLIKCRSDWQFLPYHFEISQPVGTLQLYYPTVLITKF